MNLDLISIRYPLPNKCAKKCKKKMKQKICPHIQAPKLSTIGALQIWNIWVKHNDMSALIHESWENCFFVPYLSSLDSKTQKIAIGVDFSYYYLMKEANGVPI